MYHINLAGQVGECKAEIACPFGDLDADHYTTREQAAAAYEASMKGKEVATFRKREAHFAVVSEEQKALDRAEAQYVAKLKALKTPTTKLPPKPEDGHWTVLTSPHQLRKGDVLPDGKVVSSVGWRRTSANADQGRPTGYDAVFYREPGASATSRVKNIPVSDVDMGTEGMKMWREEPHPDLVRAYEAVERERVIEDSLLNFMQPRSRLSTFFDGNNRLKAYTAYLRAFKAQAEKLKKSGINLPYTRALEFATTMPQRESDRGNSSYNTAQSSGRNIFLAVANQDRHHLQFERWENIKEMFPDGEMPFMDRDFSKMALKRKELGLL